MRVHITHRRLQHGIGQGGFHSAIVKVRGDDGSPYRYDYVYDCGAVSFGKKSLLTQSITSLNLTPRSDSAGPKVIDALVLSHYDQDHIVGAKQLTSLYDVRRIYLPYLSPEELPLVLASQAESWRPMQIRALHRLATGGGTLFGVNVSMVGPTSGLEGQPDLPPDLPFPRGDDVGEAPANRPGESQFPLNMVGVTGAGLDAPGRKLPASAEVTLGIPGRPAREVAWTLRFWNRGVKPELLGHLTKNLAKCGFPLGALDDPKGAAKIVDWLGEPTNKEKAVQAYRVAINATRPPRSRAVWASRIANHISLGLYSGPADVTQWTLADYQMRCWDDTGSGESFWGRRHLWWSDGGPNCRTGWLGTGDAPLGEVDVWADFEQRYRRQLDEVLTVQVPHHGAAPKGGPAFFHPGLLPQSSINAVVSAGVKNAYEHPEPSVTAAIKKAGGLLTVVNELKQPGFEECIYFHR